MTTIEDAWKSYENRVVPPTASLNQRHQTRLAFYAGFSLMFSITEAIGDPNIKEADAFRLLKSFKNEIIAFNEDLKKRMI
jgi:hypothetical protein